ncbi:MAG: SURF1 family protein [Alphaproteobacteria bacterium]
MRFRPLPGLTVAALLGVAALIGLGVWQLHRLTWKTQLIAAAETRSRAAPVDIAGLIGRPAGDIEYAHARARGEFVPGEALLFSKIEDGRVGYQVIAPFHIETGQTILVDRGFVEATGPAPAHEAFAPPPAGSAEIVGLVRRASAGFFTPRPDALRHVWYARDAAGMGRDLGLPNAPALFLALDAGPPGARPEGGQTKLTFRNEHLDYALTWFSLAAVLVGVYLAYHRGRGRLQF